LFTQGKTAMAFHGTWASGSLMNGQGFKTGVFMPPWNKPNAAVVPIVGNETGFAVSEAGNKAAAIELLEYLFGQGYSTYQNKRQNIPALKKVEGQVVADPQILDYVKTAQSYATTASPYYSFLPATVLEMLHPLMQNVLLGKTSPEAAAREFDQAVKLSAQRQNK
jgi:multiple sugar transport system substrate-binding protein/raffinose/stachyose/melibiose transport system substrate-binding protein